MNGIEKIIEYIRSESKAECEAIETAAAEECARIRSEHAKTEQEEYWKMIDAGRKEADLRLSRLNSLAALEAKKQILMTQQEMVSSVFELAVWKLVDLPKDEYISLLAKLACSVSASGDETIILSRSDYRRVGEEVLAAANSALRAEGRSANLTLSEEPANIRGGLILSSGKIEVNCSVDALVERYRKEMTPKIASMLFE